MIQQLLLVTSLALLAQLAEAQSAEVSGIVVDSLHNESLANAKITLGNTGIRASTNADGRFAISNIPPGTYDITATHPAADSLGLLLQTKRVSLGAGEHARVIMAIPAASSIKRIICGIDNSTSPGVIRGKVRKSNSDDGVPGVKVLLTWLTIGTTGDAKGGMFPDGAQTTTDERGYYTFCGLPADFEATAQAMSETDTTGAVAVSLAWSLSSILVRPFILPRTSQGTTRIRGRVIDDDGRPVSGATVDMPGHGTSAKTLSDGSFSLAGNAGTQTFRVRKLGFPATVASQDIGESSSPVELKLGLPVPRLATVVVRGMLSQVAARSGFARRSISGPGKYVTAEQLEMSRARCVLDGMRYALIYLTKGLGCSVKLVSNQHFRGIASLQGLQPVIVEKGEAAELPVASVAASACMVVYIDEIREPTTSQPGGDVVDLNWLDPRDVAGIEFYSAASAPGRFGQSRCNTILIWTLMYHGAHY